MVTDDVDSFILRSTLYGSLLSDYQLPRTCDAVCWFAFSAQDTDRLTQTKVVTGLDLCGSWIIDKRQRVTQETSATANIIGYNLQDRRNYFRDQAFY